MRVHNRPCRSWAPCWWKLKSGWIPSKWDAASANRISAVEEAKSVTHHGRRFFEAAAHDHVQRAPREVRGSRFSRVDSSAVKSSGQAASSSRRQVRLEKTRDFADDFGNANLVPPPVRIFLIGSSPGPQRPEGLGQEHTRGPVIETGAILP